VLGVHEGLSVLQSAARALREARTLKRGMPWDLGVCEPRCIEGDGLWDDCLIVVDVHKCLQHCYVSLAQTKLTRTEVGGAGRLLPLQPRDPAQRLPCLRTAARGGVRQVPPEPRGRRVLAERRRAGEQGALHIRAGPNPDGHGQLDRPTPEDNHCQPSFVSDTRSGADIRSAVQTSIAETVTSEGAGRRDSSLGLLVLAACCGVIGGSLHF
jgi:hypothetical protein